MNILIIDNSLAVTGAFKACLHIAEDLEGDHTIRFILPEKSILADDIRRRGFGVDVLAMPQLGRSVLKLLAYFPNLLADTWRLRRLLIRYDIDLIVMNDYYNLLGAVVRMFGWKGKLITYVRLLPNKQQKYLNKLWVWMALAQSNRVIAVSNVVLEQLPPHPNATVVYDYVSVKTKTKTDTRLEDRGVLDHTSEAIENPTVQCLYLANYIVGKGQPTALEAFALARDRYPQLRLRFVGGDMGLDKNRQYKSDLIDKAKALGIENYVCFDDFSKNITRDILACDISLNFSSAESFSFTCLEASALGRPVIATRSGGPEEIVVDQKTGILVELDDIDGIAESLIILAKDADMRSEMGCEAIAHVNDFFSRKQFKENLSLVINGLAT